MAWSREAVGDERGAGLVEYALLLSLVAIVAFGAVGYVGDNTADKVQVMGVCLEQGGDACVGADPASPTGVPAGEPGSGGQGSTGHPESGPGGGGNDDGGENDDGGGNGGGGPDCNDPSNGQGKGKGLCK